MLFNSLQFLVFFPLVVGLYFLTPPRRRWLLLLAASYYFYACWKIEYLLLIVGSTLIDYYTAIKMGDDVERPGRRKYLILSLTCNLGLLGAFKYFNFFNDSLRFWFQRFNLLYDVPTFQVLLPVGISFYTFQTLSYSIDVYRGHKKPERHLGIFALFVSFFPQLVAGPIERSRRLLPQFHQHKRFDWRRAREGLTLMGWGFFTKLVVADRLSVYVDEVYNHPGRYHGLPVVVGTYLFVIQIYCDFAGYSNIAIGAARVMGYDLMVNFRRPFLASSFREFWARWHISLTTWFRDYLYGPLRGRRKSAARNRINNILVFAVSGLWHGANWGTVLWGFVNGAYLVLGEVTRGWQDRWARRLGLARVPLARRVLNILVIFQLFAFTGIMFRSASFVGTLRMSRSIFGEQGDGRLMGPLGPYALGVTLLCLAFFFLIETLQERQHSDLVKELESRPALLRWPIYYAFILATLMFGQFDAQAFLYFQF